MVGLAVIMAILGCIGIMSLRRIIESGGLFIIIALVYVIVGLGVIEGIAEDLGYAISIIIVSSVGIIAGIIVIIVDGAPWDRSTSSSGSGSMGDDWAKRRMNNPHTCDTCVEYSHPYTKCKSSGEKKSLEESCSNWR